MLLAALLAATIWLPTVGSQALCLPAALAQASTHKSGRPFAWPTSSQPLNTQPSSAQASFSRPVNGIVKPAQSGQTAHNSHSKTKPEPVLNSQAVSKAEPSIKFSKTPTVERVVISTDRLFDPDQSSLMPGGELALLKLVDSLSQWKEHPVVIECHTDSFGFDTYIRKLSQERADRLRLWFVQRGLLEDVQVTAVGVGKSHPLANNQLPNGQDNIPGMAVNRRIEIIVDKTKAIEVAVLDPIHESIGDPQMAPVAEKQDWAPADEKDSGDLIRDPEMAQTPHESNPIIDALPTQEGAQKPRGTQDSTSQAPPPKANVAELDRQREWEHKEFGLWREDR